MSDKKVSFAEVLMTIGAVIFAAMLFIPFSAVVLDVFARIVFVLASAILIYSLTRYFKLMPKLILLYSLISLAFNISLGRLMLSGLRNGITEPQLSFMSAKINGVLLINILFLVFFVATIIFLLVGTKRIAEKAVRMDLVGSVKFLAGNVKASLFMVLIEITGGILIEKYRNGKSMLESINKAVALTTENVKLFLPSLVLVTIAIGFKITKQACQEV